MAIGAPEFLEALCSAVSKPTFAVSVCIHDTAASGRWSTALSELCPWQRFRGLLWRLCLMITGKMAQTISRQLSQRSHNLRRRVCKAFQQLMRCYGNVNSWTKLSLHWLSTAADYQHTFTLSPTSQCAAHESPGAARMVRYDLTHGTPSIAMARMPTARCVPLGNKSGRSQEGSPNETSLAFDAVLRPRRATWTARRANAAER